MTPETPETPESEFPEHPKSNSGNSGISIDTGVTGVGAGPVLKRHLLDHPGVVKIKLGASASGVLATTGKHLFAVVTDGTGEHAGSSILHVRECPKELLDAAWGVIAQTHKATRVKTPSRPLTEPTPNELRKA